MPVLGEQEGHQLRMHGLDAAELPFQEAADEVSVHRRVIPREMDVLQRSAALRQVFLQFLDLGGLPRPVQAFHDDEHDFSFNLTNITIFAL